MSRPGDFDNLLGTRVVLSQPSASQPQTFMPDAKLSEDYQTVTQQEYDEVEGSPYAATIFSCHDILYPAEQGFLRVYAQIPVDGPLRSDSHIRAQQAIPHFIPAEVEALTAFDQANCSVVPKLLGVGYHTQGPQDYVPGGYMVYVAWSRVSGEPLDIYAYWKESYTYRQEVRAAFRTTFE